MNARRVLVAAVATAVLGAAGRPTVVAAAADGTSLGATVEGGPSGGTVVAVTEDGSPVGGASRPVSTASDATGADGATRPPTPDDGVEEVAVVSEDGNEKGTPTRTAEPSADRSLVVDLGRYDDGTATVTVTRTGAAVGNATVTVAPGGTGRVGT
jgi:hypothetical protein